MRTAPELGPAVLATRLAFFLSGFAIAAWAPLVPFAKANLSAGHGMFGALLLSLGLGAVLAMPLAGRFVGQVGAWRLIILGGLGMSLALPLLVLVQASLPFALALLVLGAALGVLDISMNIHGLAVEIEAGRPMMSNFHAFFSLGGILGAAGVTLALGVGASSALAAFSAALVTLAATVFAAPRLLRQAGRAPSRLALPRGKVLLLVAIASGAFLAEGSVLDWGALLLVERHLAEVTVSGSGYVLFAVFVTLARLCGDGLIRHFGAQRVLQGGGVLACTGIALMLLAPSPAVALAAFAVMGAGLANIIPILFSLAGGQKEMDPNMAVAAVTMAGYAGIMLGPAFIGLIAGLTGLVAAFWVIGALLVALTISAATIWR